jgi:hypothetical protein
VSMGQVALGQHGIEKAAGFRAVAVGRHPS